MLRLIRGVSGVSVSLVALSHSSIGKCTGADCAEPVCDDKKQMFASSMKGMRKKECPLNKSELGRSTWNLLHTTAIYFPEEPSCEEKSAADMLIRSVATLYPCLHCREHFVSYVDKHPPMVDSKEELSIWVCRAHNAVNIFLDKQEFNCEMSALDTRWRTGCAKGSLD